MPFTTWIRDLFGIRKDYVETERSVLEVEKLEAEKRERDLITPATLEDVKKYDPKTIRLINTVEKSDTDNIVAKPLGLFIVAVAILVGMLTLFPKTFDIVRQYIAELLGY